MLDICSCECVGTGTSTHDRLQYAFGALCSILDETLQDVLDISMTETLSVVLSSGPNRPINGKAEPFNYCIIWDVPSTKSLYKRKTSKYSNDHKDREPERPHVQAN
jgi:hypothetical protein